MKKIEKFQDNEIPYETLASFGLTKEMVDDLPMKVLEKLLSGQRTPLLPISVQDNTGKKVDSLARLSLVRTEDGIDVMFMPYWESTLMEELSTLDQMLLKEGTVIKATDGSCFYQLDKATGQIISMPAYVIEHNLGVLRKQVEMVNDDFEQLQMGAVVTFGKENETVTIGLDLTQEVGIRMVDGDKQLWDKEVTQDDFPLYSFGISGCWVNNGSLSYVKEEDYTQDMLEALGEKVSQAKKSAFHR